MADALVVGSRLGETGLAATSLALPVYMLINLFMDGFGRGGSVYFSQKLGEGDTEQARNCFNRTWTAVLAFGLITAAVINIFPQQCLGLLGTVPSDGEVYTACLDYIRIVALGAPLLMLERRIRKLFTQRQQCKACLRRVSLSETPATYF